MLDNREMKKMLVVVLAVLVLLGAFIGIRSCNKSDKEQPKEIEEKEDNNKDEEKTPVKDKTEDVKKEETQEEVTVEETKKEEEKPVVKAPVIKLPEYISVSLNEEFKIPVIEKDENGNPVTTKVVIEFLAFGTDEYVKVDKVDSTKLGLYKVTYIVSNGSKTTEKTVIIEIVDEVAPTVTANIIIPVFDQAGEVIDEEKVDVEDGSIVDDNVYFEFADNDQVEYAEYYKAIREVVNGESTIEKDSMANVVEIDLSDDFVLTEDGEYYIRVYDRSGNVTEFNVTIDREPPVVENVLSVQYGDELVALILFNERIGEAEDFEVSNYAAMKLFQDSIYEEGEVYVTDLIGNGALVDYEVAKILRVFVGGQTNNYINHEDEIQEFDLPNTILEVNQIGQDAILVINDEIVEIEDTINLQNYISDEGKCEIAYIDGEGNMAYYSFSVAPIQP